MKNKQIIEIFKLVSNNIDTNLGRISIKGQYAEETKNLTVSSLIPYFTRDIFLAQKDEVLFKTRISFNVIPGINCPSIEIALDEVLNEENFMTIQLYLVQILWNYNYISYDAMEDHYKQRFSYVFTFRTACDLVKAA